MFVIQAHLRNTLALHGIVRSENFSTLMIEVTGSSTAQNNPGGARQNVRLVGIQVPAIATNLLSDVWNDIVLMADSNPTSAIKIDGAIVHNSTNPPTSPDALLGLSGTPFAGITGTLPDGSTGTPWLLGRISSAFYTVENTQLIIGTETHSLGTVSLMIVSLQSKPVCSV